jgi:hypothetical protein
LGHVIVPLLVPPELLATATDRDGGGDPVAPWHEDAVQPDFGHVIVPPLVLPELLAEATDRDGGGDPVAPWHEDAVQPDFGHVIVPPLPPLVLPTLAAPRADAVG